MPDLNTSPKPPSMRPCDHGKVHAVIFHFADIGDELGTHSHKPGQAHLTIVLKGKLRIYGDGWERIVEPGAFLKFLPDQNHAYVALYPGSEIVNIVY